MWYFNLIKGINMNFDFNDIIDNYEYTEQFDESFGDISE